MLVIAPWCCRGGFRAGYNWPPLRPVQPALPRGCPIVGAKNLSSAGFGIPAATATLLPALCSSGHFLCDLSHGAEALGNAADALGDAASEGLEDGVNYMITGMALAGRR